MSTTLSLVLPFGIGVIAGLRSMTAPAVVAWAAHWKWLDSRGPLLGFLGSTPAALVLALLAICELVVDKLPRTPSRRMPVPFLARILSGALSGGALCAGRGQGIALGVLLGVGGAVVGTLAGYELRTRSVKALKAPDLVIALLEDVVAIGVGFFLVSRPW